MIATPEPQVQEYLNHQQHELITERDQLADRFPLPAAIEAHYSLAGKQAFLDAFIPVRDAAEDEYYAIADQQESPGQRTRKFLASMINPVIGKPMRDAEHFYQTFGRLLRSAWLSISVGLYEDEIQKIDDLQNRLLLAQVNNVDRNWRPALSHLAQKGGRGTVVEVGTGRGNSIIRMALMFPEARFISITISPEQHKIVQSIVQKMNLKNVEIRCGNIFDPAITADLIGQADAVGAIEVVLHFPAKDKLEGMRRMTDLLKVGSPLCIIDSAIEKPLGAFAERYYANQSIYFGIREQYFSLFEEANLDPACYIDYTPDMNQSFRETGVILRSHRPQLRREFGLIMSWIWPYIPGNLYLILLRNVRYVQATGIKI